MKHAGKACTTIGSSSCSTTNCCWSYMVELGLTVHLSIWGKTGERCPPGVLWKWHRHHPAKTKTASHIELIHQSVLADCLQIWYHTYPALTNFKYSVLRTCTRWFLIMLAMSSLYIKFRKFAAEKICCYTIPFHSLSFPCSALTPWICCKGGGDGKATIASS